MSDFDSEPFGNTDEDGETGYVQITRSTLTPGAAGAWLISEKGAREVMGCDLSRRVRAGAIAAPARITLSLPVDQISLQDLDVIDAGALLRDGVADGWWAFDNIYSLTEDVEPEEWRAEWAAREARSLAEEQRRAREDRGPLWWRARCALADLLGKVSASLNPGDRSSAGWHDKDAGVYVIVRVRGYARDVR